MTYYEDVVSYKARKSRQHDQPAHSEVALEGQQCRTKQQWTKNTTLWHTRYDVNTRTTHTIYLNFLSTTEQKILEHLQDHSTNSGFPQFKRKAPMINPIKGRTEVYLDERKLSTPVSSN